MKRLLLLCIGMMAASTTLFAAGYQAILETQRVLEERIGALVHMIDPRAIVLVEAISDSEKRELPGAPFLYEDYLITSQDKVTFSHITVKVITHEEQLPDELMALIKETTKPYSRKTQVQLRHYYANGEQPAATTGDQYKIGPISLGKPLALALGGAGAFLVLLFLGIWAIGTGVRQGTRALSGVLSNELAGLRGALDSGVGRSSVSDGQTSSNQPGTATSIELANNELADYPVSSCRALISDCYWCEQDNYAVYLWHRFSVEQRTELVKSWPILETYIRHCQDLPPRDMGLHREIAYLSPVRIDHLDNKAIADAVRKSPSLLLRLSPMRVEALPLSIEERIKHQSKMKDPGATADLASLPASTQRQLRAGMKVRISSNERESEVFSVKDFSVDIMEQFITLAWLVRLPKEQVAQILEKYSARDLAQAWIGPERLLQFLGECIPKNKLELVQSYKRNVVASRNSEVYLSLHRQAMETLRKQVDGGKGVAYAKAA